MKLVGNYLYSPTHQFINLIQKEDRVIGAHKFQAMYDASRHGADVSTTMASDVRLVTATTKGNPTKEDFEKVFNRGMMGKLCLASHTDSQKRSNDGRGFAPGPSIDREQKKGKNVGCHYL